MTYYEICARLSAVGIEEAAFEASVLLEHFCGVSAASLPLRREEDFSTAALSEAVARREQHEPLQYLIGVWGFCGQEYEVNRHTLIPRADTEVLVEEALRRIPRGGQFIDLCTGSGCIAVSTLCMRRDTRAYAVDLFGETLEVARRNAARNGVADRLQFLQADVLQPLSLDERFDAILSNPPYIRTEVVKTLAPELAFEPSAALDGGEDGLIFYRAILSLHRKLLKPGGVILFEIGYDQGEDLRRLATAHGLDCRIVRDLGDCDRVAVLTDGEN